MNMKRKKTLLAALAAVAVVCGAWLWLRSPRTDDITLQTAATSRITIRNSVMATGTVEPVTEVEVGTQVSGIIDRLYVDYNDVVKAGQLIAEMDKVTLQAQLEQSQAELASCKTEYEYQMKNYTRTRTLHEKQLVSDAEYDEALYLYEKARNAYEQAKAAIVNVKRNLGYATITSPIDGVVVSLNAVEDQQITGTEPLVVVADLNDIVVNADVMSTDVGAVQEGQLATMNMYTYDGSELMLTGTVESVALEPTQDASGSQGSMPTFRAVIAIDPIEGQSIYSGMMVDYQITTASSMDCLMVPTSAIVNTENGTAVFAKPLTDENGEEIPFDETLEIPEGTEGIPEGYYLVPVEIGISDSTNTEILWGVDEGTTVYLAGPQDLYSDMMSGDAVVAVG